MWDEHLKVGTLRRSAFHGLLIFELQGRTWRRVLLDAAFEALSEVLTSRLLYRIPIQACRKRGNISVTKVRHTLEEMRGHIAILMLRLYVQAQAHIPESCQRGHASSEYASTIVMAGPVLDIRSQYHDSDPT